MAPLPLPPTLRRRARKILLYGLVAAAGFGYIGYTAYVRHAKNEEIRAEIRLLREIEKRREPEALKEQMRRVYESGRRPGDAPFDDWYQRRQDLHRKYVNTSEEVQGIVLVMKG